MKAVIQRVLEASVLVSGKTVGAIGPGLLVYLGLERGDTAATLEKIGGKILSMRIFSDTQGKMNLGLQDLSPQETPRGLLLVSQFTLAGDLRRGRRPGFDSALPVEEAREFWPLCVRWFQGHHTSVAQGEFQADMQVHSINDGPVTLWLDSNLG